MRIIIAVCNRRHNCRSASGVASTIMLDFDYSHDYGPHNRSYNRSQNLPIIVYPDYAYLFYFILPSAHLCFFLT